MIVIRKLKNTDIEQLAELYYDFWHEKSSVQKMHRIYRKISSNANYLVLVAVIDKHIAGSVMAVICDELYGECKPFALIENMIVHKDYRRMGIGRKLFCKTERILAKHGCSQILLVTETTRKDAQKFYQSVGFSDNTHKGYKKRLTSRNDS